MNSGDTFQLIQSLLRGPMDWLRDKSILPRKIQPSQSSGDVLFTDSDGVAKWGTTGSSAPAGPAGGVLSGSYPNPGFAVDMATQSELDGVQSVLQSADATEAAARLLADSDIYGSAAFAISEKSDYDHTHYLGGDLSGTPETATVSLFNGQLPSYYLSRANHTGTQLASTVSDFTTAVQAIAVGGDLSGTVGNAAVSVSAAALYAASAAFDYGLSEKSDYDHTHYLGGDLTGTPENASLTTAAAYAAQVTLDLALSEKAEYEHTHYLGTQLRGTPEDSHIVPGTTPGSILQTPGTVWDVAVWDESLWDGADPVWVDPYFAKFVTSDQVDCVLSEKSDYDHTHDPQTFAGRMLLSVAGTTATDSTVTRIDGTWVKSYDTSPASNFVDTTNKYFVAPVTGYYDARLSIYASAHPTLGISLEALIYKNAVSGADVASGVAFVAATSQGADFGACANARDIVFLSAGDTLIPAYNWGSNSVGTGTGGFVLLGANPNTLTFMTVRYCGIAG